MKGWLMYSRIQQLKEQGFSIRNISRLIRVSRNTIAKYWDMPPDEYAKTLTEVNKLSSLSAYEEIILHWLQAFPCMTAAQVRDWLLEKHKIDVAERTVRRYVVSLREKYDITKQSEPLREYEAVDELPKGFQLQMDFGVKWVRDAYSPKSIKLYVAAFSLSYSRFKWGIFQIKPYTSVDLVKALYGCFEYFRGQPRQLVYDQDSILVVSENNGDIIHTQAFAAFLSETKLETLVCRKSDPETKGKIESVVKFIKGNFMQNRMFMGIDIWNQSFEEWLVRTGNGKIHGTTKRKPAEMFTEEQEHLLPLIGMAPQKPQANNERAVYKDNVIIYCSNRYSVPLGTYGKHKKVFVEADETTLTIYSVIGDEICTHLLCKEKGRLIKADSHRREAGKKTQERLEKAISLLGVEFQSYLTILCSKKPRYVKEQLNLVVKTCESFGRDNVLAALVYCTDNELFSANDLAAATSSICENIPASQQPQRLPVEDEKYHISVQQRPLSAYSEVAGGVKT